MTPVLFGCKDRVVHWKRVDLHFTFIGIVLVKDGGGLRARLGRSRYRRGASPSLPPPADARQGDADDDLSEVRHAP